ncbi:MULTISPECIES: DnaB-like helicase N-terminal domain-containing protein [unclassified Rhodococcus (in: high G+C Gram-positive bacteria)]|uniref:DnaB-like helicase N-terminal domain-containing protein n=1 Tax=unclassified Rhodococcus (in: high G+C Gram-positive bacteria) TaxID=192944 RepID=UPI000BC60542|nr:MULTISPECIES: DnaB-like helicase N-terminal domain-containing protein [unclassified Rhodococcus (in: high G+C Gram-positive bacteria)]MBP1157962.1 replicative DNA helicase [Rhodococcus sp. PvR099]PTR37801.1 DnaB helicase-like protein [Rhodococcus sp. OK611]SNX93232.1 DnaB-like helicase N terminal domain-containing protein [Rhodococcus sp. OK270]
MTEHHTHEPDADPEIDYVEMDLDPEAHLLCAALWSRDETTLRFLFTHMREDNFENPFHRPIFTAIGDALAASQPHDPTIIAASYTQAGRDKVPTAVHNALRTVLTLGSSTASVGQCAASVVAASYRSIYFAARAAFPCPRSCRPPSC